MLTSHPIHVLTRVQSPNIASIQTCQTVAVNETIHISEPQTLIVHLNTFYDRYAVYHCGLWRSSWVFPHLKLRADVFVFILCVHTFGPAHQVKVTKNDFLYFLSNSVY